VPPGGLPKESAGEEALQQAGVSGSGLCPDGAGSVGGYPADGRGGEAPSALPFVWALRPKPRVTFLRKESHQRFARNLLVPGPPAQEGGSPWIPQALCPSGIG